MIEGRLQISWKFTSSVIICTYQVFKINMAADIIEWAKNLVKEWCAWVLLVLFLLYLISTYNRLIGLKNRVSEARAGVEVYFKQRADLVPNLVASMKRYMKHERELLERIIFLRSRLLEAKDDKEKFFLEGELGRLLGFNGSRKLSYA